MRRRTLFAVVVAASAVLGAGSGYAMSSLMTTSVSGTPTAPKPADSLFPRITPSSASHIGPTPVMSPLPYVRPANDLPTLLGPR
jgi:hypothetical protein